MPSVQGFGPSSYPGVLPPPPTPPTTTPRALATGAPTPQLPTLIIIVAGDATVTTSYKGANVQKR